MEAKIETAVVRSRIGETLTLLRDTYSSCPDGGGWYHELESPDPGYTATAVGLLAFAEAGEHFDHFAEGLRFLRTGQCEDPDPTLDGGWPTKSSMNLPVVEATAWVARFLVRGRCVLAEGAPDLDRACQWLLNNQNNDNGHNGADRGGWGSRHGHGSRVWLTCLALRALVVMNPHSPALKAGIEWLMANKSQHGNLAWGETRDRPPTVTHTAFALITLVDCGYDQNDDRLTAAYGWLRENLTASVARDKYRSNEHYYIYPDRDGSVRARMVLWHDGLPIAISALLHDPRGVPYDLVARALQTLMRDPPAADGSSNHGTSLWPTWWALEAMLDVKHHSLARPGDLVVWTDEGVLVQRAAYRDHPLASLVPRSRRDLRLILIHNWASLLLILVLLICLTLFSVGLISANEAVVGLVFPTLLAVIQQWAHRRIGRGHEDETR